MEVYRRSWGCQGRNLTRRIFRRHLNLYTHNELYSTYFFLYIYIYIFKNMLSMSCVYDMCKHNKHTYMVKRRQQLHAGVAVINVHAPAFPSNVHQVEFILLVSSAAARGR